MTTETRKCLHGVLFGERCNDCSAMLVNQPKVPAGAMILAPPAVDKPRGWTVGKLREALRDALEGTPLLVCLTDGDGYGHEAEIYFAELSQTDPVFTISASSDEGDFR